MKDFVFLSLVTTLLAFSMSHDLLLTSHFVNDFQTVKIYNFSLSIIFIVKSIKSTFYHYKPLV